MFDYTGWIKRAVEFTHALRRLPGEISISGESRPPLSATEVDELARQSKLPIPDCLRLLWTSATSYSDLGFHWEIPDALRRQRVVACGERMEERLFGGPTFESAERAVAATHDFPEIASQFRRQNLPRDARLWEYSIPVIPVANGDFVALYVRDDAVNPTIAYLCHEGGGASQIVSSNLPEFLRHWEQLSYVGIDFLAEFCRPGDRLIDPSAFPSEVAALTALLRGEVRHDFVKPPRFSSEREWATCTEPDRMLLWLEELGLLNEKLVRLYCCACCRRVWDQLGNSGRHAIEVTERYTAGLASEDELETARTGLAGSSVNPLDMFAENAIDRLEFTDQPYEKALETFNEILSPLTASINFSRREGPMQRVCYAAVNARWYISSEILQHLDDPDRQAEQTAQAELVRKVFGSPFDVLTRQ